MGMGVANTEDIKRITQELFGPLYRDRSENLSEMNYLIGKYKLSKQTSGKIKKKNKNNYHKGEIVMQLSSLKASGPK
jgi:hypothetical protein